MRVIIFWVIALMALPLVSYAQVDTLELVEIGSIQASSTIRELYVEDLDGDSQKEIILCTDYFVYIYNSQTYQVEWTSPPLIAPTDLLFEDINGDGLIDLSVKDSTNIHLFDPHTPGTIWTSPPLDSTYKCYTIGDKDDDVWKDLAIVHMIQTDSTSLYDTARTVIFSGPGFIVSEELTLPMINYDSSSGPMGWGMHENPIIIRFYEITTLGQNLPFIVLISSFSTYSNDFTVHSWGNSGFIYLIDPDDFSFNLLGTYGPIIYDNLSIEDDSSYIFLLDYHTSSTTSYERTASSIYHLSADTLLSYLLWNQISYWGPAPRFNGQVFGNISNINEGDEFAYACRSFNPDIEKVYLKSRGNLDSLWTINFENDCHPNVLSIVKSNYFDFMPSILCADNACYNGYILIEGITGEIRGYLSYNVPISKVADLDFDGNDEILSIQGSALYIYNLDYATGVWDKTRLPQRAFLKTNYPNPFNSSTTIEYGLPEAGHVNIVIYDLLGRKVETIVNEEKQAGRHQVLWEADRYASGLYFYRIESGDFVETKRMVYLK